MMTEKIKITGTPPKYDEAEFQHRLDDQVKLYKLTTQSMEGVNAPLPHDFLEAVAAKVSEGYTVSRKHAVISDPLHYSCMMIKPDAFQALDIAELKLKVKAEYVEWLETERAHYQGQLRQQLIQAQEERERKSAEQAKAKKLAQIEAEVQACYSPLEIPA